MDVDATEAQEMARTQRVVAGYDGSKHARRAVQWAAAEAARRRARLEVICVVDDGGLGIRGPVGMAHWWTDVATDGGHRMALDVANQASEDWPELEVEPIGRPGLPAQILVDASRTADLLVVGTRGRNPLVEMALGSVAERVASHGHSPVVVVHGDPVAHPGPDHPVLVGVDDSAGAGRAAEFAAHWAHEAGAALVVTCAWTPGDFLEDDVLDATQGSQLEERAVTAAREAVAATVGRALDLYPDLKVTGSARPGVPAQVLTDLAAGAGLLVVGSRGRGAFASLVLGSVSHALVRTAPCAVAVVGEHAHTSGDPADASGAEQSEVSITNAPSP